MTTEEHENTEDSFFRSRRPWSKIKDTVLENYMPPYLRKVSQLRRPILLIDCFAGPGKFEDNKDGSPLIMCKAIEEHAKGKCIAIFVNKEIEHHKKLIKNIKEFTQNDIAIPIFGDSQTLLNEVRKIIKNHTLFVYLDPFGLKGCDFESIKSLLQRGNKKSSTEILINLSMPTLHRLAARRAVAKGEQSTKVKSLHKVLNNVFGGEYWQKYMFDDSLHPQDMERKVMEEYRQKLQEMLPYIGSCPVRERVGARIKYYITFCSRHPDAMVLMNDHMCDAYNQYLHEVSLEGVPLLASVMPDWKTRRGKKRTLLKDLVLEEVKKSQGQTRGKLWESIIFKHFMKFRRPEFIDVVQKLVDTGELISPTNRPTKRLNDNCTLYPKDKGSV